NLLTVNEREWFRLLGDCMNQKTCRAEDLPRAGNVDDLDSIVDKHGDFRRTAFAICWNQGHSALRTVARLIERQLVAGLAARRTDVGSRGGVTEVCCAGHRVQF